ncbi:MAG: energy transducer TonB [Acidobacteria bacterium]|nr:energy transducer TonB [Acidobacteriota bacterium]
MRERCIRYGLLALALVATAMGQVKKISHSDLMATVAAKTAPEYPAAAKQLRVQGTVEVEVFITEDGKLEKAEPVSGNPILTRAAVECVKQWKFKPSGSAVQATLSFNFKL